MAKRNKLDKTKKVGSYSRKIKNPSSMMYGPTKHSRTHNISGILKPLDATKPLNRQPNSHGV